MRLNPMRLDGRNPSPMTGAGNNTYLLAGPANSATLIDAGVGQPEHLDDLDRILAEQRWRLERVLVTHAHADHASGASAIAARHPSARFYKYPWSGDERYAVTWRPLQDGTMFETVDGPLQTLHTPGHSPDHLAFWHQASRTIFSGDLVARGSSVMIHASGGGDLRQYLASLERLRTLDAAVLLPAHGPAIANPEALLREYLAHRRQREKQVIQALRDGLDNVPAIAESIYDGLERALLKAAHENVRAHLDKLTGEGRAFEHNERWTLERHHP
jgi:glyoxylase-like metal-dependent hydrolase (beta-lactamase superfamily II)